MRIQAPRFDNLRPASHSASTAARGSSKKRGTRCEVQLRRTLLELGMWSSTRGDRISGKPDLVFRRGQVVVFCDGDYWHGRDLERRVARLANGHNAAYWVAKITSNVERDKRVTAALENEGWLVLRYWETDIKNDAERIAREVAMHVRARRSLRR